MGIIGTAATHLAIVRQIFLVVATAQHDMLFVHLIHISLLQLRVVDLHLVIAS